MTTHEIAMQRLVEEARYRLKPGITARQRRASLVRSSRIEYEDDEAELARLKTELARMDAEWEAKWNREMIWGPRQREKERRAKIRRICKKLGVTPVFQRR